MDRRTFDDIKQRHPGMILLFRHGDNEYRGYFEDFHVLDPLPQTKTVQAPDSTVYACFAATDLETVLRQLLKAGNRVAICDPVADQK